MRSFRAAALICIGCFCLSQGLSAQSAKGGSLKLYFDGKYEDSRQAALAEIAANSGDIEPYVVICWDLLALKRWADAENYGLKAYQIKQDPRITEALAEAAYNMGHNDTALRDFQNYVSVTQEGGRVGQAYYYMGEIYLRMARYAHADIAFSTALQYSPGSAGWWARLGWAREKAGDIQSALSAYNSALGIDPRLQDALLGRDRTLAILKR